MSKFLLKKGKKTQAILQKETVNLTKKKIIKKILIIK